MTPKSEDNFAEHFSQLGEIKLYTLNKLMKSLLIIPGASEPSVRTLRATIPENESQPNFLILV